MKTAGRVSPGGANGAIVAPCLDAAMFGGDEGRRGSDEVDDG